MKFRNIIGIVAVILVLTSCSKDWLKPMPLSFFSPENTYIDEDGIYSAITACERNMRHLFFGSSDNAPICTQLELSDVAVFGKSDESMGLTDIDAYLTPSHIVDNSKGRCLWFWNEGWNGIKYANIVLNRLSVAAETMSEEDLNAVRGQGYFHRAYRYFNLINEFGDVPWLDFEIQEPKLDFYTYDRWSILEQLEKDMEYAYAWVREVEPRGRANKWSCGILYMKILMSNGKFDEAIKVGQEIIAANPMVTKPISNGYSNLMLDLNSIDTKKNLLNTEGLLYIVSLPEFNATDSEKSYTMRNGTPYWAKGSAIKTPAYVDEKTGATVAAANGTQNSLGNNDPDKDSYLDNDYWVGRGIGCCRPSNYYQYDLWTDAEREDMRGRYNSESWRKMEDLYYNNTGLRGKNKYYGQHLVRPDNMSVVDSIRCWFSWPHYKLWVPDPSVTSDRRGGESPWYVYRTAEVYLMIAECYYWKGDLANELAYINPVRVRAGANPLTSVTGITEVLNERARELYYEELRHDELVRIAFTYAKTGKACEAFGGRIYDMAKFSGNSDGENLKQEGYNFYWDWVNKVNGIFNRGVVLGSYGEYKISVHHALWPVPESAITSNTGGVINQTPGYVTSSKRITPLRIGENSPSE